eukprot:16434141-Heterocapsa_arctica.AAC.1
MGSSHGGGADLAPCATTPGSISKRAQTSGMPRKRKQGTSRPRSSPTMRRTAGWRIAPAAHGGCEARPGCHRRRQLGTGNSVSIFCVPPSRSQELHWEAWSYFPHSRTKPFPVPATFQMLVFLGCEGPTGARADIPPAPAGCRASAQMTGSLAHVLPRPCQPRLVTSLTR